MPGRPAMVPSDEELACRAQQGCAASFEDLVRRYQVPVLHFLQHRGAGSDGEDLLQDTFLRAYENLHRYRPRWPFAAWLFTIARRLSINHHRRIAAAPYEETLEGVADDEPGPGDAAAQADDRRQLWARVARALSEEEYAAVWLYYVEGFSARQIAAVLGRSWLAVKSILFRARKRLAALLRPLGPAGIPASRAARNQKTKRLPLGVEVPHA